jgi:hypothetical protein
MRLASHKTVLRCGTVGLPEVRGSNVLVPSATRSTVGSPGTLAPRFARGSTEHRDEDAANGRQITSICFSPPEQIRAGLGHGATIRVAFKVQFLEGTWQSRRQIIRHIESSSCTYKTSKAENPGRDGRRFRSPSCTTSISLLSPRFTLEVL